MWLESHADGTGGTPSEVPLIVNSAPRIIPEVVDQVQACGSLGRQSFLHCQIISLLGRMKKFKSVRSPLYDERNDVGRL